MKSLEALPLDKGIFKEKTVLKGSRKLITNLRNVLRDEVKIIDIVKSFTNPEDVFIINTNWETIQVQLRVKFCIYNPNTKTKDYREEIVNVNETLQNKPVGTVLPLEPSTTSSSALAGEIADDLDHTDGSPSDFIWALEDK
jgi:hypothetical protein